MNRFRLAILSGGVFILGILVGQIEMSGRFYSDDFTLEISPSNPTESPKTRGKLNNIKPEADMLKPAWKADDN